VAVTFKTTEDTGSRLVTMSVAGAPDITSDQSYITYSIRPSQISFRYVLEDGGWLLEDVEVRGRAVDSKSGNVNPTTRRTHGVVYRDLTNKGGIQKAVTPGWVVSAAKQYADPAKLPTQ
jgi:hypothetical protein